MQQQMAQNKMQMQQMQREQGDVEMNGQRPQTPGDPDNGGSPSKRPRLDGQHFNGQLAPNGRGQGVPPQVGMMMQNGMPKGMGQGQFQGFQNQNPAMMQKQNMQVYAKIWQVITIAQQLTRVCLLA